MLQQPLPGVNQRVDVWFDGYDEYYGGRVESVTHPFKFHVILDDNSSWHMDTRKHIFRLSDKLPPASASASASASESTTAPSGLDPPSKPDTGSQSEPHGQSEQPISDSVSKPLSRRTTSANARKSVSSSQASSQAQALARTRSRRSSAPPPVVDLDADSDIQSPSNPSIPPLPRRRTSGRALRKNTIGPRTMLNNSKSKNAVNSSNDSDGNENNNKSATTNAAHRDTVNNSKRKSTSIAAAALAADAALEQKNAAINGHEFNSRSGRPMRTLQSSALVEKKSEQPTVLPLGNGLDNVNDVTDIGDTNDINVGLLNVNKRNARNASSSYASPPPNGFEPEATAKHRGNVLTQPSCPVTMRGATTDQDTPTRRSRRRIDDHNKDKTTSDATNKREQDHERELGGRKRSAPSSDTRVPMSSTSKKRRLAADEVGLPTRSSLSPSLSPAASPLPTPPESPAARRRSSVTFRDEVEVFTAPRYDRGKLGGAVVADKVGANVITALAVDAALEAAKTVLIPLNERMEHILRELDTVSRDIANQKKALDTEFLQFRQLQRAQQPSPPMETSHPSSSHAPTQKQMAVASPTGNDGDLAPRGIPHAVTIAALQNFQLDVSEIIGGGEARLRAHLSLSQQEFESLRRTIRNQGESLRELDRLLHAAKALGEKTKAGSSENGIEGKRQKEDVPTRKDGSVGTSKE